MSKALTKTVETKEISEKSNQILPDYLIDTKVSNNGLEGLDATDYKLPRIKLLQALSPEVKSFPGVARPDTFWHDGANISLGNSFKFVPALASKKVALWAPRASGGKLLAFSSNGVNWDTGGMQKFQVMPKDTKKTVTYFTNKDVRLSNLLEWGSSDPEDEKSAPAATLIYEYLCHLPDHPGLSPSIFGVYKTAIINAKQLNTRLLMSRQPSCAQLVECFAEMKFSDKDTWSVPNYRWSGFVDKATYDVAKEMANSYNNYKPDYTENEPIGKIIEDDIKY